MEGNQLDSDKFLSLVSGYAQIIPYRSPDFSSKAVAWYWYQEFKTKSLEDLRKAFDRHIKEADHYPSIRELNNLLSGTPDKDTLARITAMNILGAIPKFGYCNWTEAKVYIGELGVKVVDRFGGWPTVCEMLLDDNFTYLQKIFCESAKSYLIFTSNPMTEGLLPEGSKNVYALVSALSSSMDINTAKKVREGTHEPLALPEFADCPRSTVEDMPW